MPDLTPELGLQEAVGDDDTNDYLIDMLGPSLSILDGLFHASTGHNHSGAHQGGRIDASALLGPYDYADWIRSTARASAFAADGVGLEMFWDSAGNRGAIQAYDRTADALRDVRVTGQTVTLANADGDTVGIAANGDLVITGGGISALGGLTINGTITATGDILGRYLQTDDGSNGVVNAVHGNLYLRPPTGGLVIADSGGLIVGTYISAGGYITAGATLSGTAGDITANRGGNAGYVFLGIGSRYVGFDGSNYQMPGANLYVVSSLVATEANTATLSNKTLVDPRVNVQVASIGGASATLPDVTASAGKWRFLKAWGQNMTVLLTNGTLILFTTQYSSGQYVLRNGDSLSCWCDGGNWWVI